MIVEKYIMERNYFIDIKIIITFIIAGIIMDWLGLFGENMERVHIVSVIILFLLIWILFTIISKKYVAIDNENNLLIPYKSHLSKNLDNKTNIAKVSIAEVSTKEIYSVSYAFIKVNLDNISKVGIVNKQDLTEKDSYSPKRPKPLKLSHKDSIKIDLKMIFSGKNEPVYIELKKIEVEPVLKKIWGKPTLDFKELKNITIWLGVKDKNKFVDIISKKINPSQTNRFNNPII